MYEELRPAADLIHNAVHELRQDPDNLNLSVQELYARALHAMIFHLVQDYEEEGLLGVQAEVLFTQAVQELAQYLLIGVSQGLASARVKRGKRKK